MTRLDSTPTTPPAADGFERAVIARHTLVVTTAGELRCRCGHGPYEAIPAFDNHKAHQQNMLNQCGGFLMDHDDAMALPHDRWDTLRRFETTPAWTPDGES